MSNLKMSVPLVQFECQSVPKMSDVHFWPKMNVSELNFFMMLQRGLPQKCQFQFRGLVLYIKSLTVGVKKTKTIAKCDVVHELTSRT